MFPRLSIDVPSMDTTTPSNTLSANSSGLNIRLPSMKNIESGGSNDSTYGPYSSADSCQSTPTNSSVTSPLHKPALRIELNIKPTAQRLNMSVTPLTPTTKVEFTFGDGHIDQENLDTNSNANANTNSNSNTKAITVTAAVTKQSEAVTKQSDKHPNIKADQINHLLIETQSSRTHSSSSSQRRSSSDMGSSSRVSSSTSSDHHSHNQGSSSGTVVSASSSHASHASDDFKKDVVDEMKQEQIEMLLLGQFGYRKTKEIAATLQGNIFVADVIDDRNGDVISDNDKNAKKCVVIKKTSRKLHNEHITIQNGKKFGIYENILKECIILKYLTENKSGLIMTSFTKYVNFISDSTDYYLVMEHGGSDLFDFIIRAHELIQQKKLKIKEWRKFSKYLFWQMIVVLKWLHSDLKCCHLDISLENILIKNGNFILNEKTNLYQVDPNVQIKFCDFGLAELFSEDNPNFTCVKYCGKTNYKAPEVYAKQKPFDARKADIWSTGVVLFCMMVGSPPYNKPTVNDQAFLYVRAGKIDELLFQWQRNHFITVKVLSLLHKMLRFDDSKRFLIDDVIKHPWLSLYYHKYKYQMQKKSRLQSQKNSRNKFANKLPMYKLPNAVQIKM